MECESTYSLLVCFGILRVEKPARLFATKLIEPTQSNVNIYNNLINLNGSSIIFAPIFGEGKHPRPVTDPTQVPGHFPRDVGFAAARQANGDHEQLSALAAGVQQVRLRGRVL